MIPKNELATIHLLNNNNNNNNLILATSVS